MGDAMTSDFERALLFLSDEDPDGATEQNGRGFNGRDTVFGNEMARLVRAGRALTQSQYQAARKVLQTYRAQVQAGVGVDVSTLPVDPPAGPSPAGTGWSEAVIAKFSGACIVCRRSFAAGESIRFRKAPSGQWERRHDACTQAPNALPPIPTPCEENKAVLGPSRGSHEILNAVTNQIRKAVDRPPVETASGLSARGVLGPGGLVSQMLPGYEHRESQLEGADLFERTIAGRGCAIAEMGTGSGKSLAALAPAINSRKKILYSTADKALQAQIAFKDVPFLTEVYGRANIEVKAAVIKGRQNYVCLNRVQAIREQMIPDFRSPEAAEAWGAVDAWINVQADTGDVADLENCLYPVPVALAQDITTDSDGCTGRKCPEYGACFVERAKGRAREADVVISNHALLLRDLMLRAQTEGQVSVLPESDVIILDECHHLEDVATDAFGSEITLGRWNRLAARIEKLAIKHKGADSENAGLWSGRLDEVSQGLDGFLYTLQKRLEASKSQALRLGDEAALADAGQAALHALGNAMFHQAPHWLEEDGREVWRKMTASVEKLSGDLDRAASADAEDEIVRYVELDGVGKALRVVLHVKPIDVSQQLRESLFDGKAAVIAMSATVATAGSTDYWQERVGCDEAEVLIAGSPFDYGRAALLYLPADGRAFDPSQQRGDGSLEYLNRMAGEIERLILASDGRAFILFTSYRAMHAVFDLLSPRLRKYLVLRQGDEPRLRLVQQFREHGNAVLFGTKSFWEGVDVQGEALSLVIIDKLPFAPPDDPVWESRCKAVNRKYGDDWAWFRKLAIPVATIALKQGFGRLIRTKADRGVVALLDGRLSFKPYGAGIVRSLPPATLTNSIEAVKAFYGA